MTITSYTPPITAKLNVKINTQIIDIISFIAPYHHMFYSGAALGLIGSQQAQTQHMQYQQYMLSQAQAMVNHSLPLQQSQFNTQVTLQPPPTSSLWTRIFNGSK